MEFWWVNNSVTGLAHAVCPETINSDTYKWNNDLRNTIWIKTHKKTGNFAKQKMLIRFALLLGFVEIL